MWPCKSGSSSPCARSPSFSWAATRKNWAASASCSPTLSIPTWEQIETDLRAAMANPPQEVVVPKSNFAAYAGVPLIKKLGIKPGSVVALVGAPPDFRRTLGDLPEGARLLDETANHATF